MSSASGSELFKRCSTRSRSSSFSGLLSLTVFPTCFSCAKLERGARSFSFAHVAGRAAKTCSTEAPLPCSVEMTSAMAVMPGRPSRSSCCSAWSYRTPSCRPGKATKVRSSEHSTYLAADSLLMTCLAESLSRSLGDRSSPASQPVHKARRSVYGYCSSTPRAAVSIEFSVGRLSRYERRPGSSCGQTFCACSANSARLRRFPASRHSGPSIFSSTAGP